MALLLEIVLTLILIIAAIKLGWLGTILFVLLYIIAFGFKLPFLARRSKLTPQFLAFVAVFITSALVIRWGIASGLSDPTLQDQIASSSILRFFFGSDSMVAFWSFLGGILGSALLAALVLAPYGHLAGFNMYSQHENYKGHEREAAQSAISILLGINRGTWVVSNGQAEVRGESGSSLQRFGGPGVLIVQEGHAVILEISGKLSRVVGRGITMLKPFERISMVAPLTSRSEHIIVENVATREKVIVDEFEFWAYHKVDAGSTDQQVANGLISYNPNILVEKVWSPGGGDWKGAIRSVGLTVARDFIGRLTLEEIMTISDDRRVQLKKDFIKEMNKVTKDKMGIEVVAVDFGHIKVPERARSTLLEKWDTRQHVEIAEAQKLVDMAQGEAQTHNLSSREAARAVAQKQMIVAIIQGLQTSPALRRSIPNVLIRMRLFEALEKIAEDPATKLLLPHQIGLPSLGLDLNLGELLDVESTQTDNGVHKMKRTDGYQDNAGDGGGVHIYNPPAPMLPRQTE